MTMNNTQRIEALEAQVDELKAMVEELKAQRTSAPKARDYGPDSQRPMDEYYALRILVGRYRKWTTKKIAEELGFSKGQVYSLTGGYTFKPVHQLAKRITERRAQRSLNK